MAFGLREVKQSSQSNLQTSFWLQSKRLARAWGKRGNIWGYMLNAGNGITSNNRSTAEGEYLPKNLRISNEVLRKPCCPIPLPPSVRNADARASVKAPFSNEQTDQIRSNSYVVLLWNDKFSIPDTLSSQESWRNLWGNLWLAHRNISKDCRLLPNLRSGEPGSYVIVTDLSVAKGFCLWDTWVFFFFNGVSSTVEEKAVSSFNRPLTFLLFSTFLSTTQSLLKLK